MSSDGTNASEKTLINECVRLQLFRCSFGRTVDNLDRHLPLEGWEKALNQIFDKKMVLKVRNYIIKHMKSELTDAFSDFDLDDMNRKLKILEEVTEEGVYDKQPKWRPSGSVEEQLTPHLVAEKLILKEQIQRDLEKETAETNRLREKIAMKRKKISNFEAKYNKLRKQNSEKVSTLRSFEKLETNTISSIKTKLDKKE